jgi:16S rRNA (uracil1498-N3)-methyltransferase
MSLPFFYSESIAAGGKPFILNEETSRHVAQVLRMPVGDQIQLTDGKGNSYIAAITDNDKRKCAVEIRSSEQHPPLAKKNTLAVSLVKNAHRFEWFLEKATEIGVWEIVPLLCTRTEKQHFRADRMKGILVSAMLQSQQAWLPQLREPVRFVQYVKEAGLQTISQKLIAHCKEDDPRVLLTKYAPFNESILMIGPEGDFTIDEIELALTAGFLPVTLGNTRLRTETAGVVAATLLSFS